MFKSDFFSLTFGLEPTRTHSGGPVNLSAVGLYALLLWFSYLHLTWLPFKNKPGRSDQRRGASCQQAIIGPEGILEQEETAHSGYVSSWENDLSSEVTNHSFSLL